MINKFCLVKLLRLSEIYFLESQSKKKIQRKVRPANRTAKWSGGRGKQQKFSNIQINEKFKFLLLK